MIRGFVRERPHELKEADSSLIYASSRSGEMPELHHVFDLFSSMFGGEFVRLPPSFETVAVSIQRCSTIEAINQFLGLKSDISFCIVQIVQKLSTRQPSLESRMRFIEEIAAEKGITLDLTFDEDSRFTKVWNGGICFSRFCQNVMLGMLSMMQVDLNSFKNKNQAQVGVGSGRDSPSGRTVHKYKDVGAPLRLRTQRLQQGLQWSSQSDDDHDNQSNDDQRKKDDGLNEDRSGGRQQFDQGSNLDKGEICPV